MKNKAHNPSHTLRRRLLRTIYTPLSTALTWLLLSTAALLPYCLIKAIAHVVARTIILLSPRSNKLIMSNLDIAFPTMDLARKKVIKLNSLKSIILTFLETSWISVRLDYLKEFVEVDKQDLEELKQIQSQGHGQILITPHLGNWEVGGLALAAHGLDISVIAKKIRNPYLEKVIKKSRESLGADVIHSDGAARGILKALKKGKMIGMLMDQNTKPRRGGIFCQFFDLQVPTTRLPASMAIRAKAKVKVISFVRLHNKLKLVIADLPDYSEMNDETFTSVLIAGNETLIKQYPEQWMWLYERWRYIPSEATDAQKKKYPYYATH